MHDMLAWFNIYLFSNMLACGFASHNFASHKVSPVILKKNVEEKSFITPVVLENTEFEGVYEKINDKGGSFEQVVELLDEVHDTDSTYSQN
jgi:hypothetical protein